MPSGGNRTPANPAPSSGPGALSQRTDGGPASKQAARYIAGGDYGDAGLMGIQQGAPMAATPTPQPQPVQMQQQKQGPQVVPLTAGTQRPDEPITSGADAGPGPGSASLGLPPLEQQGGSTGRSTVQTFAQRPDASPQLKQLAANLGG